MGVYARIFYATYAWQHRLWGEIDGPQYNAALGLSFIALINLTSLAHLAGAPLRTWPEFLWGGAFLALAALHWFAFVRSDRYRRLPREFNFNRPERRGAADLLAVGYAVLSVGLLIAAWSVSPVGMPAA